MDAWGHTLTVLIGNIPASVEQPSQEMLTSARILDKYYIPTRYPYGFDSGAPTDYYTEEESRDAIQRAEGILEFCRIQID